MDRDEAARKFREADGQFQAQHFGKALDVLNELDAAFPRTPRVLHPKAMCLAKLGRTEDALAICATLITELHYPKAMALQQELQRQMQAAPKFNFDVSGLDDLLSPTSKRTAPPPLPQGRDWKPWWIGGGIALVIVILAIPLFAGQNSDDRGSLPPPSPTAAATPVPAADEAPETLAEAMEQYQGSPGAYIIGFLVGWFANFWLMFIALGIMKKLPGDTFFESAGDIGVFSAIITLVNVIPIIGFIAELIIVSKKYDLSCGELVLFVVIQVGVVTVIVGAFILLLLAVLGAATEPATALLIAIPVPVG